MSVYNSQDYIYPAIKSVLLQSFRDFEFLIMDDGSTDNSRTMLEDLASKDNRIKLFYQSNRGITYSLNRLICLAEGEFIARIDADDISYPHRLAEQINYLLHYPKVGIVSSWFVNITSSGAPINCVCFPNDNRLIVGFLEKGINPFAHSSVMFRKELVNSLEVPYRFRSSQDFDLWLRMSSLTDFAIINDVLVAIRQHNSNISSISQQRRLRVHDLILDMHCLRKQGLLDKDWQERENDIYSNFETGNPKSVKVDENYQQGIAEQLNGNQKEARTNFRDSLKYSVRWKTALRYLMTFLPPIISSWCIKLNNHRPIRYNNIYKYSFPIKNVLTEAQITNLEKFYGLIHKPCL